MLGIDGVTDSILTYNPDMFTPLSNHPSFLANICTSLSSKGRPLSFK